jgi:hypothetical protein
MDIGSTRGLRGALGITNCMNCIDRTTAPQHDIGIHRSLAWTNNHRWSYFVWGSRDLALLFCNAWITQWLLAKIFYIGKACSLRCVPLQLWSNIIWKNTLQMTSTHHGPELLINFTLSRKQESSLCQGLRSYEKGHWESFLDIASLLLQFHMNLLPFG